MCEPLHSIVQFDDKDDHDSQDGSGSPRSNLMLAKIGKWGKRIKNFFHISRMGSGHSEAMQAIGGRELHFLTPESYGYEVKWTERRMLDDNFGRLSNTQESRAAAQKYADKVSIGSLQALRRFLEASFQNTTNAHLYLKELHHGLLNDKGRGKFSWKRAEKLLEGGNIASLIRYCLGYTRKRHLLVPAWAEDTSLWVPERKLILPVVPTT